MARRMRGPKLSDLMRARAAGEYAASTPGEEISPEQAAALQSQVGPASGYSLEVGTPVEQVVVPGLDLRDPPKDVLAGLVLKAAESNPKASGYMPMPAEVREQFGIDGVDLASLSIGEKVMLRRMGVQFPAPARTVNRAGPTGQAAQAHVEMLKRRMGAGGGVASPFLQAPELQRYREAWGQPPLLKGQQGPVPYNEGPYDPMGDLIIGNPRR